MSEDRDRGLNKQQQKEMVHMILKELGVAVSQDPMPAASLLSSPTEWNVGTLCMWFFFSPFQHKIETKL